MQRILWMVAVMVLVLVAGLNAEESNLNMPLIIAAQNGVLPSVKLLLALGADI